MVVYPIELKSSYLSILLLIVPLYNYCGLDLVAVCVESISLMAEMPSFLGMFVYRLVTSRVHWSTSESSPSYLKCLVNGIPDV